jgi:hypothetical protein
VKNGGSDRLWLKSSLLGERIARNIAGSMSHDRAAAFTPSGWFRFCWLRDGGPGLEPQGARHDGLTGAAAARWRSPLKWENDPGANNNSASVFCRQLSSKKVTDNFFADPDELT